MGSVRSSEEQIVTLGRVGWVGRGVMMVVIGWFLVRAAVDFRPDEAVGIDGALREMTSSTAGALVALFVAVALVVYGVFCLVAAPKVRLKGRRADVTVAMVLVAALTAAAIVAVVSRARVRSDPVDPVAEERWLVSWLLRHPALRPAGHVDRRNVAGGLLLVIALATLFVAALVVGWVLRHGRHRFAGSPGGTAPSPTGAASTPRDGRRDALDLLTDLGGTVVLVCAFVVVGVWDFVRRRNVHVVLFLTAVLGGVVIVNNGLKWIVAARPTRRGPSRRRRRVVVPVRTLGGGRGGVVRVRPRPLAALVAHGSGRSPRPPPRSSPVPWRRRVPCSACTGSPTSSPASPSAGAGSPSAPWRSGAACSASANRWRRRPTSSRRSGLERRASCDGEHGAPVVVGPAPLQHHRGAVVGELDQAHVVGEERALLDVPTGVTCRAGGPSEHPGDPVTHGGQPRRIARRSRAWSTLRIGELTSWWTRLTGSARPASGPSVGRRPDS